MTADQMRAEWALMLRIEWAPGLSLMEAADLGCSWWIPDGTARTLEVCEGMGCYLCDECANHTVAELVRRARLGKTP